MKKVLLTCALALTSLSAVAGGVAQIYAKGDEPNLQQESTIEEEVIEENSEEDSIENKPISYLDSIKQLPEENQAFIKYMIELYSDHDFVFKVIDSGLIAKDFESSLAGNISPEQYQSIINETLGEYAYESDYNDDEVYTETKDGTPIKGHIKKLLKESIEDHQADKVYMMTQLQDVDGVSDGTKMLDTLTYYYANESNMLQILLTQLSKGNQEAQANYYQEASEELGIELTPETDISTLDQETIDKIYASEAFKKTTDPEVNPDANLHKNLSSAKNPKEWDKALQEIYNADYPAEMTGKELNVLHNAFNKMRMTRVYYYDIIHSIKEGISVDGESGETSKEEENTDSSEEATKIPAEETTEKASDE